MLHQEAVDVPHADAAVQLGLFQEQLTLLDRLLRVLGICPAQSRNTAGVRGQGSEQPPHLNEELLESAAETFVKLIPMN